MKQASMNHRVVKHQSSGVPVAIRFEAILLSQSDRWGLLPGLSHEEIQCSVRVSSTSPVWGRSKLQSIHDHTGEQPVPDPSAGLRFVKHVDGNDLLTHP